MRVPTTIRRHPDAVPLLELRKVSAGYAGTEDVIHDVTLTIEEGEVAAAVSLDMSGGKSTLLRVAAGLLQPRSGQVLFRGQDVYAMSYRGDQAYRAKTAVVLEGGALLVNMSIWDNVALPLQYHGGKTAREVKTAVERLLAQCGYNEDPHALPWQVSARGRRLAAFARALARDPALVLVDRFYEGLELPDMRRLFEVVMELNQHQQVAWVLISEVDPSIFQVAERVAVLERGRLIAYDFKNTLFQNPRIKAAFDAADLKTRIRRQTEKLMADDSMRWQTLRKELLAEDLQISTPSPLLGDVAETINIDGRMPELDELRVRQLAREEVGPNRPGEISVPDPLDGGLQTTISLRPEELAHAREPATDPDAPTPDPDAPTPTPDAAEEDPQ